MTIMVFPRRSQKPWDTHRVPVKLGVASRRGHFLKRRSNQKLLKRELWNKSKCYQRDAYEGVLFEGNSARNPKGMTLHADNRFLAIVSWESTGDIFHVLRTRVVLNQLGFVMDYFKNIWFNLAQEIPAEPIKAENSVGRMNWYTWRTGYARMRLCVLCDMYVSYVRT